MKVIKKIVAIIVIVSLLLSASYTAIASTQSEKEQLEQQKKEAENELNNISEAKDDAESELESINEQLEAIQDEIASLKMQLSDLNEQISQKEAEIKEEEKEIEAKDQLLKQRMVALYEAGDTSYLDVLFNSEDLIDFMSGYSAIQTILEADTNLINELEEKKDQLEKDKNGLEESRQKVQDLKNTQEIKSATYVSLQKQKEEQVSKLSDEEKAKQAEIDKFTAAIAEAEAKIQREAEEARRKAEEEAKNNANNSGGSNNSGGYINNSSGTLGWPLPAKYATYYYITSYFGPRKQPTAGASTNHGAIDIGVRYQPVYAPESGVVLIAEYVSGYGEFIMLWHKGRGELYTCFGHLSQYYVSAGQTVQRGQQIAVSGNTGITTGPHLHFEVRDGGSSKSYRRDPLNYVNIS